MAFFHSKENLPVRKQVLKIMLSDLQIESPHMFNIRILILSWPWALFGSMSLIIQRMSSFVTWKEYDVLSVRNGSLEGKTLPFEIREQWPAKKGSKISLFSWKSTIYLSSWNGQWMRGFFFPLNSVFRSDHYYLLLVFGSTCLWAIFIKVLFCYLNRLI